MSKSLKIPLFYSDGTLQFLENACSSFAQRSMQNCWHNRDTSKSLSLDSKRTCIFSCIACSVRGVSCTLRSHGQGDAAIIATQRAAAVAQRYLHIGSSYCANRTNINFIKLTVEISLWFLLKIRWNLDANIFTGVNQAVVLPQFCLMHRNAH